MVVMGIAMGTTVTMVMLMVTMVTVMVMVAVAVTIAMTIVTIRSVACTMARMASCASESIGLGKTPLIAGNPKNSAWRAAFTKRMEAIVPYKAAS